MNTYSNAQYVIGYGGVVSSIRVDINDVTSYVPIDPANTDYQNILVLVGQGALTIVPVA